MKENQEKKNQILLVSDIHISGDSPEIKAKFYSFLSTHAIQVRTLVILGDLFDIWLGDDLIDSTAFEVAEKIKSVVDSGTEVLFMHGNRDFSIGKKYANLSGMKIIDDEYYLLALSSGLDVLNILLCHGDQLCTFDISYQRWKKFIRNRFVLNLLSKLPIFVRKYFGGKVRKISHSKQKKHSQHEQSQQEQREKYYSVSETAVSVALKQYKADIIIHGHTHKPADYANRYVLSAWYKKPDYLCIYIPNNNFEHIEIMRLKIED